MAKKDSKNENDGSSSDEEPIVLSVGTEKETYLPKTRNYQAEMFEESMRRNIIVAMDTGSGKTHIAIMRIRAQLDRGDGKISWFLVPGVELAKQQYQVLKSALPPVSIALLMGSSGVDKWSNKETWDELLQVPVIISTHQVLLDALTHGFVQIDRIGLLVFDEAHHCVHNHPANMIMRYFYHERARDGLPVPEVLGLTASPIMKSNPAQLKIIESNLNAISRTPLKHRKELMDNVRPPELRLVVYGNSIEQWVDDRNATNSWADLLASGQQAGTESVEVEEVEVEEVEVEVPNGGDSDSDFETIDPATGELMKEPTRVPARTRHYSQFSSEIAEDGDDEFDDIDPLTGEMVYATAGRAVPPKRRKSAPAIHKPEGEDEVELIDPYTGEPLLPEAVPTAPATESSSFYRRMSASLASLMEAYENMDIIEDPYVIMLQKRSGNRSKLEIERTISSRKTYSHEHMKSFVNKASHIMDECGVWATDWFITGVVRSFLHRQNNFDKEMDEVLGGDAGDEDLGGDEYGSFFNTGDEARYVRGILQQIVLPSTLGPIEGRVTAKVGKLIEVLLEEHSAERSDFSGLVFVTQRAAVAVVAHIISQHPKTRDHFRVGTMVGASTSSHRNQRFLHEVLVGGRKQEGTLKAFRAGELNLLIATSAIEEGIDIQDCHLVVCFDLPHNLKSFVQRRGRARREASSYVIMLGKNDPSGVVAFQEMEREMIKMYSDPDRALEHVEEEDEEEEGYGRAMRVEKTQALLTFVNVLPHLYHFCACQPMGEYVDSRPEFRTVCKVSLHPQGGCDWTAEVVLPNFLPQAIRRTSGTRAWKTERAAKRDAAFEAFLKLYHHHLVDEFLMPLVKGEFQNQQEVQKRAPRVQVDQRMDIWADIGKKWGGAESLHLMTLTLDFASGETASVDMMLPVEVPDVEELELFWMLDETVNARFGRSRRVDYDPKLVERGRKATRRLMLTMFDTRMDAHRDDFSYLFLPCQGESWDMLPSVYQNALALINEKKGDVSDLGLLRNTSNNLAHVFKRLVTDVEIDEADDFKGKSPRNREKVRVDQPLVEVNELPKRRDFLHVEGLHKTRKTLLLLPEFLVVESLPWKYIQMALFLPALINRVEKALLAADLKRTLRLDVPNQLLVHATTASAARDPVDYQRLEFLGDSVLKILASAALMDEFQLWPEGYLTAAKDHVVSNGTSSKSAAEKCLSRWINLAPFTALKWKPRYADSDITPQDGKMLSTKILADVVESIIGVSYLTGGYDLATQCCATFNLGVDWTWLPLSTRASRLRASALQNATKQAHRNYPTYFTELQQLLGYTFHNPLLLLEATTHLSYGAGGGDTTNTTSYQRLEFLGDAVLDTVVVNTLYHFPGLKTPLSHINMHHLKSTCVNAHFLAYLCLGYSITVERLETSMFSAPTPRISEIPLHRFLRNNNPELRQAQDACTRRYKKWKNTISEQLETALEYPWMDLQELDAPKHLSDIIESIIGAIWVDSNGSFDDVEAFLERLGVMKVLGRLVRDEVIVNHPLSRFGIMVAGGGRMGVVKYHCEQTDNGLYSCELSVDGMVWTRVERCASRQHARTKAAHVGIGIFEAKVKEEEQEAKNKKADEEDEKRKRDEEGEKWKREVEEEVEVEVELHEDDENDEEESTDAMEDDLEESADPEVDGYTSRVVLRSVDVLFKKKSEPKAYESSSEDAEFFDAKDYPSSAVSEAGGGRGL